MQWQLGLRQQLGRVRKVRFSDKLAVSCRSGHVGICPRGLVEIKLVAGSGHPVARRIGNPAIDLGFAPAGSMDADRYLRRERPFGNLAINRRTRQSCAMKDGFEANDTVWFWHVRVSIAWLLMTLPAMKLAAFSREKRAARVYRTAASKRRRTAAANWMVPPDADQVRSEEVANDLPHLPGINPGRLARIC